jgi:hypothetical protein
MTYRRTSPRHACPERPFPTAVAGRMRLQVNPGKGQPIKAAAAINYRKPRLPLVSEIRSFHVARAVQASTRQAAANTRAVSKDAPSSIWDSEFAIQGYRITWNNQFRRRHWPRAQSIFGDANGDAKFAELLSLSLFKHFVPRAPDG